MLQHQFQVGHDQNLNYFPTYYPKIGMLSVRKFIIILIHENFLVFYVERERERESDLHLKTWTALSSKISVLRIQPFLSDLDPTYQVYKDKGFGSYCLNSQDRIHALLGVGASIVFTERLRPYL